MKKIYWLLPIMLWLVQVLFTANSMGQIRYEELAESVRNPFWLENKTIYDGVSSNVGWYGTLLIIYKVFGFTLHTAKFFRLVLALISLFALAAVLRKYLGEKNAWLPLLAVGLSPTLLYFTTLQTSYGLDLQYFPIALYLVATLDFGKKLTAMFKQIGLGLITMIAWMSYPTFIFYLPILAVLYCHKSFTHRVCKSKRWKILFIYSLLAGIPFAIPIMAAFSYVNDPQLLWFDTKIQSGIFRGAGTFYPNWDNFWKNFGATLGDLFGKSNSYYFEVASTDFSNIYPLVSVFFVLVLSFILMLKVKKLRLTLGVSWSVLLLSIIVPNLTFDPSGYPGIRRSTSLLAAFYGLYIISWYFVSNLKLPSSLKNILYALLLIIPLHHVLALPANYGRLTVSSPYRYSLVFDTAETPEKSLAIYVGSAMEDDLKLGCKDNEKMITCRYAETYAAVAGSCLWNNLGCKQILGYDDKRESFILLNVKLWEDYYFGH